VKILAAIFLVLFSLPCMAQQRLPRGVASIRTEIVDGEPIMVITTKNVVKFARRSRQREYDRLVRYVKKVYPIALEAEKMFGDMEAEMANMPKASQRRQYVAGREREIQKKYTPVLREMTFTQGKILLKLIDRQTSHTSYEILLDMRGRLRASIWQGVAKLFDADLNARYNAAGEDRDIEEIISLIERGEL
jgi:hypothetical protein